MRLETVGLGKTFGDGVEALRGVSLSLVDGEFVSLVGPSGCGKSTLLAILAGLSEPSAGAVLIDGEPAGALLGRIGYMPQRDLLMQWRTTVENAAIGLELAGVTRREARERAQAQMARFGLTGFERKRPSALSGGMRQRAALLRTFLAGRDVLLLDEPFGSLDALTREAMREWLLGVWEADRKTILLVTHDVEEAVFLSDRVYVMSGRPGAVQAEVEIALPRPRALELTESAQFAELRARLLGPLRAQARAQLGVAWSAGGVGRMV
ncbi:MAG TPA: ABC transporter ATP-binding protein [Solirubrobacteraceae bacterium]|nr:ABC transporter ATP-binding protein [Solirubrobacteraceae bacterium]